MTRIHDERSLTEHTNFNQMNFTNFIYLTSGTRWVQGRLYYYISRIIPNGILSYEDEYIAGCIGPLDPAQRNMRAVSMYGWSHRLSSGTAPQTGWEFLVTPVARCLRGLQKNTRVWQFKPFRNSSLHTQNKALLSIIFKIN